MGEFIVKHFDSKGKEKYSYKTFRNKENGVVSRGRLERKKKGAWKNVPIDLLKRKAEIDTMDRMV